MKNIRLITQPDVAMLVTLHDENCLESAGHTMNEAVRRNVQKMFSRYVDNLMAYAYVAEINGRIVGYLTCSVSHHPAMSGTAGTIEEVYIQPAYRRRGLATNLVKTAASTLVEANRVGMIRTLVCADSSDAKLFWASLGYENDLVAFNLYDISKAIT